MKPILIPVAILFIMLSLGTPSPAQESWSQAQTDKILDKTISLKLSPDLSHLTDGEKAAIEKLLAAGKIFHRLYLRQKHDQADQAVLEATKSDKDDVRKLHWIFKGPIATTLENERVAFLSVKPEVPGKAVYPRSATKAVSYTHLTLPTTPYV